MPQKSKRPCVYMLASGINGTLYIGVTAHLHDRVNIHRQELSQCFTRRYGVHKLVYYEMHETMEKAIRREKQLKKWNRLWKTRLIEKMNPEWFDLVNEVEGVKDGGPGGQSEREQ